jgi:O-antigen/teichoic acid export membrane protein
LTTATIEERPQEGAQAAPGPGPQAHLSVGQSIARGALAILTVQPLSWGTSLLSAILIPRLLGSDVLGQLTIAATIASIATTFTGLGISEFLVRRVAQQPHLLRRDQGIAITVQMIAASLGFLTIALLGWLFSPSTLDYRLLLVAAPVMLVAPAQTVLLSSFRGTEQHRSYAWFCAATAVLSSLGGLIALLVGGDAVASMATGTTVFMVTTLVSWRLSGLRPSFPTVGPALVRDAWEFICAGFPFISWQVTQLAYSQIDRLLLGLLVPASEVGWYAAAQRIISMPIFIPTLIITPLFPALSRSVHAPDVLRRSILQTLRITLLLTVPLCAGTIVIAPVIPSLLGWPADFENAIPLIEILSLQLPLVSVGMVLSVVLMAIGKEKRIVRISVFATVFNILLNLAVIRFTQSYAGNGAIGAAIATAASELVMLLGYALLIPKHLLDPRTLWDMVRIVVAGVATFLAGWLLLPVAIPLGIAGGAIAYVAVAAALRILTMDDIHRVGHVVGHRFSFKAAR